ncbi:MAG TPA: CoA transferase subunit A [Myxococcota bacterium]|nr:CoA transferase subunit A [Myxococcota bacterium]HQK49556.1 CoA transferase subunit A [Myxococcota bacterium]
MGKVFDSADAAVADIPDGATIAVGGFGLCGNPENLIRALHRKGVRNLTIISNNCGIDGEGLGILLDAGQVRKIIASYVGENRRFEQLFLSGDLEVELVPQGTLAEAIRAGGAGIPAFYTATGVGTLRAEGRETRVFDGREYLLERALRADFALVKAWKGDRGGNLVYRKTARNFNPMVATCALITIAEVEVLVDKGEIDPDLVHTPAIFVQRILQGTEYRKPIEKRTTRPRA